MNPHAMQFRPERHASLVESPTLIVWSASSPVLELGGIKRLEATANTPPWRVCVKAPSVRS